MFGKKYGVKFKPHHWGPSWVKVEVWHKGKVIGEFEVSQGNMSKAHVHYRAKDVYKKYKHKQKAARWMDRLPG
jgi:hypothetical protein